MAATAPTARRSARSTIRATSTDEPAPSSAKMLRMWVSTALGLRRARDRRSGPARDRPASATAARSAHDRAGGSPTAAAGRRSAPAAPRPRDLVAGRRRDRGGRARAAAVPPRPARDGRRDRGDRHPPEDRTQAMSSHRRLLRLNRRGGRLSALRRTASGGSADPVRSGGASSVLGRDAAPRRAFPWSGVERRRGWIGQLLGVRSTALRSSGGAVGAAGRRGRWTRCSSVARGAGAHTNTPRVRQA